MRATRSSILFAGVAILLLAAACGDDATGPDAGTSALEGTVTSLATGEPLGGIAVLLLDDRMDVVVVTGSDGDGHFGFTALPAGSYLVYPFDEDLLVVPWHDARVQVRAGATATADLVMAPSDRADPYTWRIAGRITDAASGEPVAGAWVMPIGYGEAGNSARYLLDNTGLVAAVSDADGRYSMPAWPVRDWWPDGDVIGIGPVSCAATGYRPRTFVGSGPSVAHEPHLQGGLLPAPADSVLVLDIQLVRIPAGGLPAELTGTVRGRVVHQGAPRAGVMVTTTLTTLAAPDTVLAPDKVAVPGGSVASGADGTFAIPLEPGHYALRAGLLPDDGWCRDGGPGMIEILAGQILEVGDVTVGRAVMPVSPARGDVVSYPVAMLAWTSISGAERYEVELHAAGLPVFQATTTDTFLALDQDIYPSSGAVDCSWQVYAARMVEPPAFTRIAWFEVPQAFRVEGIPQ